MSNRFSLQHLRLEIFSQQLLLPETSLSHLQLLNKEHYIQLPFTRFHKFLRRFHRCEEPGREWIAYPVPFGDVGLRYGRLSYRLIVRSMIDEQQMLDVLHFMYVPVDKGARDPKDDIEQ